MNHVWQIPRRTFGALAAMVVIAACTQDRPTSPVVNSTADARTQRIRASLIARGTKLSDESVATPPQLSVPVQRRGPSFDFSGAPDYNSAPTCNLGSDACGSSMASLGDGMAEASGSTFTYDGSKAGLLLLGGGIFQQGGLFTFPTGFSLLCAKLTDLCDDDWSTANTCSSEVNDLYVGNYHKVVFFLHTYSGNTNYSAHCYTAGSYAGDGGCYDFTTEFYSWEAADQGWISETDDNYICT